MCKCHTPKILRYFAAQNPTGGRQLALAMTNAGTHAAFFAA
jgi:hypothetical protein